MVEVSPERGGQELELRVHEVTLLNLLCYSHKRADVATVLHKPEQSSEFIYTYNILR